jgi:hypothetical protein
MELINYNPQRLRQLRIIFFITINHLDEDKKNKIVRF